MEALLEILSKLHPDVDFKTADRLVDNGIIDSFDIITIIAEVDNAYGVSIPAEEIMPENFDSAKTLFALVTRLLDEG